MESITEILGIKHPVIMAPMFLVTNVEMMTEALNSDIAAAIPALNFRTDEEFRKAIKAIRNKSEGPIGVNLIVNKSNVKLKKQIDSCIELNVDFIITSLGSPSEVIQRCKPLGIKIFCDVIDLKYALKVQELGADAVIAVNSMAGGHAGRIEPDKLVKELVEKLDIPVISAGGISIKDDVDRIIGLGAAGVSVGTVFIASKESDVSDDYKNALVEYGAKDVILTDSISGTPLTVINTPYVQGLKHEAGRFKKYLLKNRRFKKFAKMLVMLKGMKSIKRAAQKPTYKTVWVAGPSIENIKEIKPVKEIVKSLVS